MGVVVSSSHVVSATPPSSRGGLLTLLPAPGWVPSHRMWSFRNRLPQRGSLVGTQVLPANLLQHGLLAPQGHKFCQEPAPVRAFHGLTTSFRHPPALAGGPPLAADGYLLHHGSPWAAGGQPASPWSAPWAAGESLLQRLEHLLPFLLHWCLLGCFSHMFSLPLWLLLRNSISP